ncbi:TPA: AbrB/MazE/SpoVT family DNA-binding domain-containing protein [Pseudomonas putida]
MSQPLRMTVKCQDPGDGSGDFIVDLHPEVLKELGVTVGDHLSIELIDGVIVLKPVREATPE